MADVGPVDALHIAFLRSTEAHARLLNVDVSAARAVDGVVGIVTAEDLDPVPGPIPVRVHPLPALDGFLQYALASDKVRYVGEPIAAVIAADRYSAEDAIDIIEVETESLPPVVDVVDGLESEASLLFEDQGSNLAYEFESGYGDVDEAFATADHIVRASFHVQRHSGVPMETRGLVAVPNSSSGRLTVWGATKVVHANHATIAGLLGLDPGRLRLIEPAVGGGFGVRGEIYPEDLLVPLMALRLNHPIRWIEDRAEHLVAANHSREQHHEAELALTSEGRILGLRSSFVVDQGAYLRTHGVRVAEISAHTQPGPYRIPAYLTTVRCAVSNKTPTGTYRAPGRFEVNFVREGLMDRAARALDMDPADLRRLNLLRAEDMPYEPGTSDFGSPIVFDSGDPLAVFDRVCAELSADDAAALQSNPEGGDRVLGIGVVPFVEDGGLGGLGNTPGEFARVTHEDGGIVIYSGSADLGQGFETTLAQVAADALSSEIAGITVVHGDTDRVERGGGTWASRGAILSANAVLLAARAFLEQVKEIAAGVLGASPEAISATGETATSADGRSITLDELARKAGPLAGEAVFTQPRMAYAPGAQGVVVEVDRSLGTVRVVRHVVAYDIGRALNPKLAVGQIEGGAAQGIGGALLEEFKYDAGGQPLASSFIGYLLPTVHDVPDTDVILLQDGANPLNPLGVKGVGEVGPAGAGAAIAAAVADATGLQVEQLPLTPDRLLPHLNASRDNELSPRALAC